MKFILRDKIKIIITIIVLCCDVLYCQTQEILNHKKYWYYKTRFNNDFIKVGIKQGESMPFNQRGTNDAVIFPKYSNDIKVGDCTAQLGVYMGVLATEYRLLKNKGQDLSKIKHELYCALNAFNRLDYFTEQYIYNHPHPSNPKTTSQPNLNGFFMRDNIPAYFVDSNYTHFNYYNDSSNYLGGGIADSTIFGDKGFTQFFKTGLTNTKSDYQEFYSKNFPDSWESVVLKSKEESQDQLYYLLMGTALVSKLVDAGETDNNTNFAYGSGQADIRQEAINIADRLLKHVGNNLAWAIRNPVNDNKIVQIGGVALPYAYALDNLGCFVKYNQDFPSWGIGFGPTLSNNCTDYRNASSAIATGWNAIATTANGGARVDWQGFYHALAGVCNCIMEDKTFKNLYIQAAISAAQQLIQTINTNLQEQIDKLPTWAQDAIATIVAFANNAISSILSLIDQLNLQLIDLIKVNTTEERLIFNNYLNPVEYSNCDNVLPSPLTHIGSKSYFGIPLWRVLHPNPAALPNWVQIITGNISPYFYSNIKQDLEQLLSTAPCEGTYNFFGNTTLNYPLANQNWSAPNRCDRMDPNFRWNTCPKTFLGEYNGLDYLFLHNLYYLAEGTSSTYDYSERNVTTTMPFNGNFSSTNKNTLGGFEYIKGYNTINNNGAADYRAGKEIALLPSANGGFNSVFGSDFHAYISPYQCSGGTYNGELSKSTETAPEYDGPLDKTTGKNSKLQSNTNEINTPITISNSFSKELDSLYKYSFSIIPLSNKVQLYPIPNNGEFSISLSLPEFETVNISIFDVNGKQVFIQENLTGFNVINVNIKNCAKGVYMAHIINNNGDAFTHKIIYN